MNMDKTYDFVIKPFKYDPPPPPENIVSNFFSRNWDSHNQNSQFKRFKKICRQLLSTINVLKKWKEKEQQITKSARVYLPLLPAISDHVIIQLGGYFSFIFEYSCVVSGA